MIRLRARPHDRVELTPAELGLSRDDAANLPWVLERVASIRKTRVGLEIVIGPFVGQLVVPNHLILDVEETFPGTLRACLAITTGGRRAGPQEAGRGALTVRPWDTVIRQFTAELIAYVRGGAEKRYLEHETTTSRPRQNRHSKNSNEGLVPRAN